MKVCFDTFGCRLSRAESLQMEADYTAAGWEVVKTHADADLVVVRGCSVTQRAERDTLALIAHLKRKYPLLKVLPVGCVRLPEGKKCVVPENFLVKPSGAVPTSTSRAYLKVQDGCSGSCTFCIVPQFRGKSVSVPFEDVLAKASRFYEAGYREIVVTGCNLSLYASGGRRLPDLLDALAGLSPDMRVRLGSLEPGVCDAEVIDAIARRANVCRFLHLPIQSASPTILRAMGRPYSINQVYEALHLAVEKLPGLGLGCDLMTGFPREGELEFLSTRGLLERFPFTNAHVFPYSERPKTSAELMAGRVKPEVRKERANMLSSLAEKMRRTAAHRFLGRTVEIAVERESPVSGWTSEYFWCELPSKRVTASRRSLLRVKVTDVSGGVLRGVPA